VIAPDGWDVACNLPRLPDAARGDPRRAVTLVARNLDDALDAPCLVGRFTRLEWSVGDVPHAVVLDGLAGIEPPATLVGDLAAVVRAASAVFGGELPYASYLFLCLFAAEGHGGLEHANSTTLLSGRTAWRSEKGYREFLSLAAHELFHAWNVKRLRPDEFWAYDYENENYTSLLWLIEGWTAYYDDLLCLRAGLMTVEHYLAVVAKNLTTMSSTPGRHELSLADSSFDAWIRLYRPDENTRNSSQNYYVNGALAAMCLDLFVRRESKGAICLDAILRELYATTFRAGRGYSLQDVVAALDKAVGDGASRFLRKLVERPFDPELHELFASFGVRMVVKDADRPHLGITFDAGRTSIAAVQSDTPAQRAGLAPGDEVLAVNQLRVTSETWSDVFQAVAAVGKPIECLLTRRGVVITRQVVPGSGPGTISLELDGQADEWTLSLRDGWLPRREPAKREA
jgi:predicted metalloprotease with PDZ domain